MPCSFYLVLQSDGKALFLFHWHGPRSPGSEHCSAVQNQALKLAYFSVC